MKNNLSEAILSYAYKYQGDWNKIAYAIKTKEPFETRSCDYSYVTIVDKDYPMKLKSLRYPPWILFYKGDFDLIKTKCIGIVGSRKCSMQALENTRIITQRIKARYCIVSGLAKGIDAQSHWSSLDKQTIGIIGCGIDRIYPYENKELYQIMEKKHLIISEYPPGIAPFAKHFPWRNRLIAALSDALIVIQATMKSGTMLTVNECLELSKPVYCLPSEFNDRNYPGCNYLISQGAYILFDEKELDSI